jgi:hypothetical protein
MIRLIRVYLLFWPWHSHWSALELSRQRVIGPLLSHIQQTLVRIWSSMRITCKGLIRLGIVKLPAYEPPAR